MKHVNRGTAGGLQSILKDEKPVRQRLGGTRARAKRNSSFLRYANMFWKHFTELLGLTL